MRFLCNEPQFRYSPHMDELRRRMLPITLDDLAERGWDQCDYVIVSGDAYVDHSSFGTAVIARVLESQGARVGIIAQPAWDSPDDMKRLGEPRYAFLVTSGAVDSMVAHYTASNKPRSDDPYAPTGKAGMRPNRAVITYTARIRQAYKGIPVIAGGIEASLRRLSHYDCWSDTIRRSLLLDAKLDLIVYGMGELQMKAIHNAFTSGGSLQHIPGTVYSVPLTSYQASSWDEQLLPDYQEVSRRDQSGMLVEHSRLAFARSVQLRLLHENPMKPVRLIEPHGDTWVVQNPPQRPLTTEELDEIYELPFTRRAHPVYHSSGGISALKEVQFSLTSTRGCYGSCTFCALRFHQGRIIQARSRESLLREARELIRDPQFKGYIHDVGGPTANFRTPACSKQTLPGAGPCPDRECLFPTSCPAVRDDHEQLLELLRSLRNLPGIKKVFIRSGIRFDHLMSASSDIRSRFLRELSEHHISGQLKVAPEHASDHALKAMGKPHIEVFDQFHREFRRAVQTAGKKQYLIPYLIAAHPGTTLADAAFLAEYLHHNQFIPDQVQEFYPTPGTVASCMYATGLDPRPGADFAPVHVPKGRERSLQRSLLHYHKPEHRRNVQEALRLAGRSDLIGKLLRRGNRSRLS